MDFSPLISQFSAHVEAEQDTHSTIAASKLVIAERNHISRMYPICQPDVYVG
jgi:hypothetical protein